MGDRFCPQCGLRLAPPPSAIPQGWRYTALRFQIDPMNPPPLRDVRYTMIVAGIALTVLAVLLLVVASIVTGATSAAPCSGASCSRPDIGSWFTWAALPMLAVGAILFGVGLWWGLRAPAIAR